MSVPDSDEINFKNYPNCAIFSATAGSLGTLVIFISAFCIYKRCLKWRGRYRNKRRLKRQKRATPVETVLSPRMSEHNSEPVYEDITAVDRLTHTSRIYQNVADLPPEDLPAPVPALYSNMTFSTLSQDTQSLPETVAEGVVSEIAPTSTIPPYISRYDSLVTWLKNMSTGVQE